MIVTRGLGNPRRGSLVTSGLGAVETPATPAPTVNAGALLTYAPRVFDYEVRDYTRSTSHVEVVVPRPVVDYQLELVETTRLVEQVRGSLIVDQRVTADHRSQFVAASSTAWTVEVHEQRVSHLTAHTASPLSEDRDLITVLLLALSATD